MAAIQNHGAAMLISTVTSTAVDATFRQVKAGANSTVAPGVEGPPITTQPLSPDQLAEVLRSDVITLQGHANNVNQINEILDGGIRPPNISDETYANFVKDITQMRDGLVESVKSRSKALAENYNVSGNLPSKQSDGTWSHGSFTVSAKGRGFGILADTYGNMTMSRNGLPYVNWFPKITASAGASAALDVMRKMTILDFKA